MSRKPEAASRKAVVIGLRRALDCDGIASLIAATREFEVVTKSTSLELAADACRHFSPTLLIADAQFGNEAAFDVGSELLQARKLRAVIYLDDEISERRYRRLEGKESIGYFSRWVDFGEIRAGIDTALKGGCAIDPSLQQSLVQRCSITAKPHFTTTSPVASLTKREMEVLKLLAEGNTVRQCADILGIATSTADNHKSRLMKKLSAHRRAELTRLAMQLGIVR